MTWVTFTVKDLWRSTHEWMGAVLQLESPRDNSPNN